MFRSAGFTEPAELATVGPEHIHDDPQQGGLPAAVRSQDPKHTVPGYIKADTVQGPDRCIIFCKIADGKNGTHAVDFIRDEDNSFHRDAPNIADERLLFRGNLQTMATVLITGGTGMLGKAITRQLIDNGRQVIILTRNPEGRQPLPGLRYAKWDIEKGYMDEQALADADHIIHLAGAGVADKRWTRRRKAEIRDSRVRSGALLVKYLKEYPHKVRTLACASAIGWYGPDPVVPNPDPFSEAMPPAADFLGNTCRQWEESTESVSSIGIRRVVFRIGIVMGPDGGAAAAFLKPMRFGIAAIPGSGKQVMSWIHIDDITQLFSRSLDEESWQGIYNAVAPSPASCRELVLRLARNRKHFFIPFKVPAFLLRLVLGEMSVEVLKSATVSCDRIQSRGFLFHHPVFTGI